MVMGIMGAVTTMVVGIMGAATMIMGIMVVITAITATIITLRVIIRSTAPGTITKTTGIITTMPGVPIMVMDIAGTTMVTRRSESSWAGWSAVS
ncbi:MAG: hypothetical protein ACHBMF_01395 [Chromatiales bacterium]